MSAISPAPFLPDADSFIDTQLREWFPTQYVGPETDPDITLPALIYSTESEGQLGNGPHLWDVTVTVNIVADAVTAWNTAKAVYANIHALQGTTAPDFGRIVSITDVTAPSRVDTSATDTTKTSDQYTGIWTLRVRAAKP